VIRFQKSDRPSVLTASSDTESEDLISANPIVFEGPRWVETRVAAIIFLPMVQKGPIR